MKVNSIHDILQYAYEHHYDLEKMRFMIGGNTTEPKWFGIYQEVNGDWVVYKNKADGTSFVRYQGESEAEAAQIIFDKLLEEVNNRKTGNTVSAKKKRTQTLAIAIVVMVIVISLFIFIASISPGREDGYYLVNDQVYYVQDDEWYYYDDYYGWETYDGMVEDSWYDDYYGDDYYSSGVESFYDTDYYIESDDDDYYSDSDDSWDTSDSWDSSDTDWGSDW